MMEKAARPGEGGEGWKQFSESQTAFGASVRAIGSYLKVGTGFREICGVKKCLHRGSQNLVLNF
jgi:hypothetical protein